MNPRPNIVLVHGAWADGSSWSGVIERLQADGYHVTAPQFPLTALADDVARLRQVLGLQDGPTIVAGHSYGGQVMTALGADAPNVAGLVYVAAFGLDQGESLGALLSQGPVTPALAHLVTDTQGFTWLSEEDFVSHFAAESPGHLGFRRGDGHPGLENAAVLVSGRHRRPGDTARCRASVRQPHGRHHRGDPLQPRPDGLPSR
jgi:pimeloyl-ACP methyl ester carboxylesterase